jgi:hypothetical protein
LREKVNKLLRSLQAEHPHSEIIVLSALAAGADTLCAEVALETGCTLIASLSMEIEEYRKDFSEEEQQSSTACWQKQTKSLLLLRKSQSQNIAGEDFITVRQGFTLQNIAISCWQFGTA